MNKKILITILLIIVISGGSYFLLAKKEKIVENKSLEKLTVQAGWLLNGEFANVCSAIVNGYYEEEGLDVELVPGGPTGASFIISTNMIAQDQNLDIGIDGDFVPLLRGKAKDEKKQLKVKAFAAFWNKNPYGFIVRKDSEIKSLKDFAKTKTDGTKYKIGITADSVSQYAIAEYIGIPVEELNIVVVGFDTSPFLAGQVDALAGYWTTQAYEIEKANIPYRFLSFGEIPGFSQPSMIAMASEKTLSERPELLTKWLKATIKGSKFVISNPEKAAEHILDPRCGGPAFNREQEEWLIRKSLPLFDNERIGWVYEEQVMNFAESYYNLGQIPYIPEAKELIDYSILNEIYK